MYIKRPEELFRPCIIKPLEDHEGLIVSINYNKCACEALVRYFMFGQLMQDWFFDFEVELKEPIEHKNDFFRG